MRQSRDNVALAIRYQYRCCRRQSAFFEMIGQPTQVKAGEHGSGNVPIIPVEPLRKMDHPLAAGRIDPVISYGKARLDHSPREERLI